MFYSKFRKIIFIVFAILLLAQFSACAEEKTPAGATEERGETPSEQPNNLSGEVIINLNYESQSGWASNQFAVWVEDINGGYIKTLYATIWTADGGYTTRPESILLWVEKANPELMPKQELDAVAGATPKSGSLAYTWDMTNQNGEIVPHGEYKIFVEGSLRWRNRVIFSGVINTGGGAQEITAEPEFIYESSSNGEALDGSAPENSMISAVTIKIN